MGDCPAAVAVLLRCCCISCVLHNRDADLRCNKRAGLIVAPMMQRNHRDLHLVLRLVFRSHRMALNIDRTDPRIWGAGCWGDRRRNAGWLRLTSAVGPGCHPDPRTLHHRERNQPGVPPTGASENKNRRSARIISLARSAIINVGEFVLPEVIVGITDASTTRNPLTPITRKRESTTAAGSLSVPIRHVPTG